MSDAPTTPPGKPPVRALIAGGLIALAALAAVAATVIALGAGGDGPALNADPVEPARDAPAVRGTGHDGQPIALPRDGRPALVTFLFTDCPDICPLIATTIREALDRAGAAADGIDVVAVSVDPAGDTPAAVDAFLERHRMTGRMDYLIGDRPELEPIWSDWLVAAQPEGVPASAHSARVVLVDDEGRQAGAYSAGVAVPAADLADDIRALVDAAG